MRARRVASDARSCARSCSLTELLVRPFGIKHAHQTFVTEEDIRALVNVGAEQNVLEEQEREMIHSVIEFGDTIVREVMTPRPDIVAVSIDDSPRRALDIVIAEGYSKLPVYEEIEGRHHRRRARSRTADRARERHARARRRCAR